MRKIEIVYAIAEKTGLHRSEVLFIIETFFSEVKESVTKLEPVSIRGFGTFTTQLSKSRRVKNMEGNFPAEAAEHYVPIFRPGAEFRDALKAVEEKPV